GGVQQHAGGARKLPGGRAAGRRLGRVSEQRRRGLRRQRPGQPRPGGSGAGTVAWPLLLVDAAVAAAGRSLPQAEGLKGDMARKPETSSEKKPRTPARKRPPPAEQQAAATEAAVAVAAKARGHNAEPTPDALSAWPGRLRAVIEDVTPQVDCG